MPLVRCLSVSGAQMFVNARRQCTQTGDCLERTPSRRFCEHYPETHTASIFTGSSRNTPSGANGSRGKMSVSLRKLELSFVRLNSTGTCFIHSCFAALCGLF
ncbi:uncharacterized protein LOC143474921 [Brachyhypopomus gauderio]|uniref:uncharacterized protein LOC143474921 n=1 Tax=Brachyhypopomus gauderio TaxID=698409 RepID=UPI004041B2BD